MSFLGIITDRNKRNVIGVTVLAVILASTLYFQFFHKPPVFEGTLRVVKCPVCETQAVQKVKDISDPKDPHNNCSACGKQVGYAFKCEDCDKEFSVLPIDRLPPEGVAKMRTMGKFHYAIQAEKCTNCGSTRTHPISIPNN